MPTYKPVGVDENSLFPTRVMNKLKTLLLAKPAATPSDGQLLAWSATLGEYTPVAPVGSSELAAASNGSNTAVILNVQDYGGTTYTPITGVSVAVPPSNGRPVTLVWDGLFNQSAAGAGDLWVAPHANNTAAGLSIHPLPVKGGETVDPGSYFMSFHGTFRIGVVNTATTYDLRAFLYRNSGGSPAGQIMNLASAPTLLRAVAG